MPDSTVVDAPKRRFRLRGLVPLLFVPAIFVMLGAAAFAPQDLTLLHWSTSSDFATWSPAPTVSTASCPNGDAACFLIKGGGGTAANYTSPASSISAAGYYVTFDCSGACTEPTGTLAGQALTFTNASGVDTSNTVTLTSAQSASVALVLSDGGFGQGYNVANIKLWQKGASSGPVNGASGQVSYPTLDLAALSAQMSAFWSFIAPAVYIIAGISLGGLIVSKVRGLI